MSYLDELHAIHDARKNRPMPRGPVIVPGLEVRSWGDFHSRDQDVPKGNFQGLHLDENDRKAFADRLVKAAFGET